MTIEDWSQPIPGVLIHKSKDVRAELNRLFPSPFFDRLRAKHPGMFDDGEKPSEVAR